MRLLGGIGARDVCGLFPLARQKKVIFSHLYHVSSVAQVAKLWERESLQKRSFALGAAHVH